MGVLLLVSLVGYLLAYNVFVRRDEAFFPILFCSYAVAVSFVLGLIGPLYVAPYLVVGIGVILLPVSLIRSGGVRSLLYRSLVHPVVFFWVFGGIWAYMITRGVGISQRDDVSHWYRMCKGLFYDGTIPKTPDILFPSYVPGTAMFVSFVSRFVGFSASNCLFAQSFINLSCCASLLSVLPSFSSLLRKAIALVSVGAVSVFLCALDAGAYCLIVDCTLGLIALAAAVYVLSRDEMRGVDLVLVSPILVFLALTKTSGLLFCVFVLVLLLRSCGKKGFVVLFVPVLFVVLYSLRQRYFYPAFGMSEQSVSVERFSSLVGEKPASLVVTSVIDTFMRSILPVVGHCPQVTVFVIVILVFGIVEFVCWKKGIVDRIYSRYLLAVYFIYVGFLAGTYVFSMTAEEASVLASYWRYMGTVVIYITGIVCYLLLLRVASISGRSFWCGASGFLAFVLVVPLLVLDSGLYFAGYRYYRAVEPYTTLGWDTLASCVPENTSYSPYSYVVIWEDSVVFDDNAMGVKPVYMSEAYLRSDHVYFLTYNYIDKVGISEEVDEALRSADYIVVVGQVDDRLDPIGEYTSSGTVVSGLNE